MQIAMEAKLGDWANMLVFQKGVKGPIKDALSITLEQPWTLEELASQAIRVNTNLCKREPEKHPQGSSGQDHDRP